MELDEEQRHAAEVRYWLAKIREQRPEDRRGYWLTQRDGIASARGSAAADRVHRDVLEGWSK